MGMWCMSKSQQIQMLLPASGWEHHQGPRGGGPMVDEEMKMHLGDRGWGLLSPGGLHTWEVVLPSSARSWSCLEMPSDRSVPPSVSQGAGGQIQHGYSPSTSGDVGSYWHCLWAVGTVMLSLWTRDGPRNLLLCGYHEGHLSEGLHWAAAPCSGMAARAGLRGYGAHVLLPSCQTARRVGGRGFSSMQVNL